MQNLIHIDHPNIPTAIKNAFAQKVIAIAAFLQINPDWLMQVMYAESKLMASAQNIQKGKLIAAGLLQWTKASGVAGAPQSLLQYGHLRQLDFVKQYFTPYKGKMHSYFDVYLVTFFPAGVGKSDDYVFATQKLSSALIASQNPAVNIIKDNKITMAEFKQYVWNSTPPGVRGLVFKVEQAIKDIKDDAAQVAATIGEQKDGIAKAIGGIATIVVFFISSVV